jgi:hypothetical protein
MTRLKKPKTINFARKLNDSRVARWFIFKPKIPLWVKFGGPWNGKCCSILLPLGIFFGHLVLFLAVWYSLWSFGIFLVCLDHEKSGNPG